MSEGTFTKNIKRASEKFINKFETLYCIEDFENKLEVLLMKKKSSGRPEALAELFRIFDDIGVEYETDRDNNYYQKLVESLDLPDRNELQAKMLYEVYKMFKQYPDPEKYLLRMVDRFSDPKDHWSDDPLRLRILKQFIRYGNYLKDAGYGGRLVIRKFVQEKTGKKKVCDDDVVRELTDDVFDVMEGATRAQLKPEGKFGLLKAVDDFAGAKFRTGGATKKMLYLFAMVYNMSYSCHSCDSEERRVEKENDIEKNLFRDYYTNNLLRFALDAYRNQLSQYELDPSGEGINYKNFAEMVYLYFLVKECSAQEKIKRSSQMIRELLKEAAEKKKNQQTETDRMNKDSQDTLVFRNAWTATILAKPEDEFKQYIADHYDFCTEFEVEKDGKTVTYGIGNLQIQEGQQTAYRIYQKIIAALKEIKSKKGGSSSEYNYGLWFVETASELERIISSHPELWPESEKNTTDNFIRTLIALNSFLGSNGRSRVKALNVDSKEKMTRTSLLVAYYYLYNTEQEDDTWGNFREVYEDFKSGIDPLLEASFYQKLDERNLLDFLIVFSTYSFLNM